MMPSPLTGRPASAGLVIDLPRLQREYHDRFPDVDDVRQLVSFGTCGHRGTPANGTFTEAHVLAIAQAICDYRRGRGIDGPVFVGKDTHCLSGSAERTVLEVFAANGVRTVVQRGGGVTPTPAVSRAIVAHNRGGTNHLSDGVILTPSDSPPGYGGIKYNPPDGGPADAAVTRWIEERANEHLVRDNAGVKRVPYEKAVRAPTTEHGDFVRPYVEDLRTVVDVDAIRSAGVTVGVDPLGGAALPYWGPIADTYGLDITVVNGRLDPTFDFVPADHDGKVRMDCTSPHAMGRLVGQRDRFRIGVGTDPDAERHGIVTLSAGLLNPNQYLAVAVRYLLTHRPGWPETAAVGKTLVSSGLIDRVVGKLGRAVCEVPVGFKWFTAGLYNGSFCFGGDGGAGASFLRFDGTSWTTDKDGILLGLLAAEITARTGKEPGEHTREITAEFGTPYYAQVDAPATPDQKAGFRNLSPADVADTTLAGDPITAKLTRAPGNRGSVCGLKVITTDGWFDARPSGTAGGYTICAESFRSQDHLEDIIEEARRIVDDALAGASR